MKTKDELLAMSHEELAEYAISCQSNSSFSDFYKKQNQRMKEILAAVGIAFETYNREING